MCSRFNEKKKRISENRERIKAMTMKKVEYSHVTSEMLHLKPLLGKIMILCRHVHCTMYTSEEL